MTEPNKPTSPEQKPTAQEMFDAVKNSVTKETHSALQEMMKDIENGSKIDIAVSVESVGDKSGLKRSDPEKWEQEKANVKKALEDAMLSQTFEGKALEDFRQKAAEEGAKAAEQNPTMLQTIKAKFDNFVETYIGKENRKDFLVAVIGLIGADSFFGKFIAKIFGVKKEDLEGADQPAPPPAPTGAPGAVTETPETTEKKKKYAEMFKGQGLTLDENNVKADIETLSGKGGVKEEDIENLLKAAMASGGHLKELKDVIDKATNNKPFGFRLADLLFQKKTKEEMDKIKTAIQNADNTLPKTPEGIQKFLDELHNEPNVDTVIAKYNKPPTAPTTPQQTAPATPPPAAPTNPPPAAPAPATAPQPTQQQSAQG